MNTFTVRHLLSLVVFAAVGAGLYFGNANFTEFAPEANIGIAIIGGLVCSIAFAYFTRPRGTTGGTTNSMSSARPAARGNGGSGSKTGAEKRSRLPHLPQRTDVMVQLATGRDVTQPERREPKPRTVENATFTIGDVEGKKVVTVKVSGTSGGQFKKNGGAHDRITAVGGVKWQHPKNDQANKACTVSGVVNANSEGNVRAALEKLGITAA
jgi:hypothetical protein